MEKKEIFDLKSTNKLLICLFSMKFMPISGSGRILASRIPDIRPDIRFFKKPDSGLSGCKKAGSGYPVVAGFRISGFKKIFLTIKKRKKLEFTNPQFFTQHKC